MNDHKKALLARVHELLDRAEKLLKDAYKSHCEMKDAYKRPL